jgi:hypothetical protein
MQRIRYLEKISRRRTTDISCGCFLKAKGEEMSGYKSLILALSLCVLLTGFTKTVNADHPDEQAVTIELTKFDVNESTLELQWNIKNNSDHDVWICDSLNLSDKRSIEVFMDRDGWTLLIRRRFDVPAHVLWPAPPYGRYTRLSPDERKSEYLSLTIPIPTDLHVFTGKLSDAESARRLVLEIGYYDENLPELVLRIIEVAEKLNSGNSDIYRDNLDIIDRYFNGLIVNSFAHGSSGFNSINDDFDLNEQVAIPYTFQALEGEQIAKLEINSVHIPMAN